MAKFNEKSNTKMTVRMREVVQPLVFISHTALNKMAIYTEEVSTEVGWLGTAYRNGDNFLIDDVFLFDQEVHATTTEITPEGLAKFGEDLIQHNPDGVEIWNSLKMWGHSHVNMGISPSGQDNQQMEEFSTIGHDFFIRLICNKKGDLAVDIYDYDAGLEFHGAPWMLYHGEEYHNQLTNLKNQIELLEQKAKEEQARELKELEPIIKAEIGIKVRKFVTKGLKTYATNSKAQYGHSYWTDEEDDYNKSFGVPTVKETEEVGNDFFTGAELEELAYYCESYDDFLQELLALGYNHVLSDEEKIQTWNEIVKMKNVFWKELNG